MKKLISTIKNIWSIKELRQRILFTLGLLMIFRFGSFVVLPGVVPAALDNPAAGGAGLLGLLNAFTGGAFNNAAVFALGIMPYISASIIVQLLGFAVPYFQRLQKREGEAGRRKLNQITRWLTVMICLVQAGGYLTYIQASFPGAISPNVPIGIFWTSNIIILTAGTIFAMWLGERITDRGIGNGISLLIMIGIIATLPQALFAEFDYRIQGNGGLFAFILELAIYTVIVGATLMLVLGVRKIPIQFAKRMAGSGKDRVPMANKRDYLPLKVNASGVMPIIFAQALMFLPATLAQFVSADGAVDPESFLGKLNDFTSVPYNIIYFFMVIIFTYVYTALLVNPQQYAEYLKRQNSFIPGVKPGKQTADFIDTVTTRITLPGSIFLAIVSILPAFAAAFGVNIAFAMFFGGTSLLILVGVVLDTLQQIESHLLMRRYDGLVKSGKIKGRRSGMQIGASM
ncbi:MAG: preprotein translocase subunit SecY [Bacteroidota bacterium]